MLRMNETLFLIVPQCLFTIFSVPKKCFFFFSFSTLKAILKGNQQVSQFLELYSYHLTEPESFTVYSVHIIKLNKIQTMILVYMDFHCTRSH